jgi:hypothetical protein
MQLHRIAAALVLATAPFIAAAGPLGQTWTISHTGDMYGGAANSTATAIGNELKYNYTSPGNYGVQQQNYGFSTVATKDGKLDLELDWSSFASWYMAYTRMYVFDDSGSVLLSTNNWASHEKLTATVNLHAGCDCQRGAGAGDAGVVRARPGRDGRPAPQAGLTFRV